MIATWRSANIYVHCVSVDDYLAYREITHKVFNGTNKPEYLKYY